MPRFIGLLAIGLGLLSTTVACGGGVEGVRVGEPSSANAKDPHRGLKGKIIAENTTTDEEAQVDVSAYASLPFTIDPLDANASAAEVDKLSKANGSIASNWVPPGQGDRWGHAQVLVNAPLAAVRTQATDYGHIKDIAPTKFKTSRIVDKHGPLTDVYLQMPMLKGLIMLWQVVRFAPVEVVGPGHEVVHGTLVKGNVKQLRIVVTMRAVDAQRTVLTCDLVMTPEFYAPQATIDEELRDGAQYAVDGLKDRSEKSIAR